MLPVFLWILTSGENYFSVSISFQTPAANAPPANGPRIKIQICSKAAPPSKSAGPMLRAGFTEVLMIAVGTRT